MKDNKSYINLWFSPIQLKALSEAINKEIEKNGIGIKKQIEYEYKNISYDRSISVEKLEQLIKDIYGKY